MVIIIFHTLPLYLRAAERKQLILLNRLSLQYQILEMLSESLRLSNLMVRKELLILYIEQAPRICDLY